MLRTITLLLLCAATLSAQSAANPDPWQDLKFLEGTWEAKGTGAGGASSTGSYAFVRELNGRILARHSQTNEGCKGPADFNCEHGDLLYVYQEAPSAPLKAIYFDNEGHVIHYDVSVPHPGEAVFLSEPSRPGPRFQLIYQRKKDAMTGRFQLQLPGQTDWKTYLEWTGPASKR